MNSAVSLYMTKLHFLKADYKHSQMWSLHDTVDFKALYGSIQTKPGKHNHAFQSYLKNTLAYILQLKPVSFVCSRCVYLLVFNPVAKERQVIN